jgi:hypothetical protein
MIKIAVENVVYREGELLKENLEGLLVLQNSKVNMCIVHEEETAENVIKLENLGLKVLVGVSNEVYDNMFTYEISTRKAPVKIVGGGNAIVDIKAAATEIYNLD